MSLLTNKHPLATRLTICLLGLFLGLVHIFFGLASYTPMVSQDYHRELKISFNAYAKSNMLWQNFIDRATLALYLRYITGGAQLLFGLAIMENYLFVEKLSTVASYGLISVDLALLLLQLTAGAQLERIAPTAFFLLLLITRLIIYKQAVMKKVGKGSLQGKGGVKPKTSTPKKNKNE